MYKFDTSSGLMKTQIGAIKFAVKNEIIFLKSYNCKE